MTDFDQLLSRPYTPHPVETGTPPMETDYAYPDYEEAVVYNPEPRVIRIVLDGPPPPITPASTWPVFVTLGSIIVIIMTLIQLVYP